MTTSKTRITKKAHTKMMMHSIQNATSEIHGILIGRSESNSSRLIIADVLPVCHSSPTKPVLDVAFRLADSYLESATDMKIMGWYTANERLDDINPNQVSLRIMSTIASSALKRDDDNNDEPLLIQLKYSNDKSNATSLQLYGKDQRNNWLRSYSADEFIIDNDDESSFLQKLLCKMRDNGEDSILLFDFEDHLSASNDKCLKDIDWITNGAVEKLVLSV